RSCPPIYCSFVQYTSKKVDEGMQSKHATYTTLPPSLCVIHTGVAKVRLKFLYTRHGRAPARLLYRVPAVTRGHLALFHAAAPHARRLSQDAAQHAAHALWGRSHHCRVHHGHPEHHRGTGTLQCLDNTDPPALALCGPA